MSIINLEEKFEQFDDYWKPRIVGELNGQYVKLAKLKGEFVWHSHEEEDELFMIIKGSLTIELRDSTLFFEEGELCIIPRGVEHRPVAHKECHVMLFEPKSTQHTGKVESEMTAKDQGWI